MVNPSKPINMRAFLAPTVFGRLGDDVLDEVLTYAVTERFEQPVLLHAAGTPLDRLRLVVDGSIAITSRNAAGKELVVSEVGPRGWAAWLACFVEAPSEYDFVCGVHSCFVALPVGAVQALCLKYPALYPLIIGEIGQRFRLLMQWASQSVLLGPEQRMAKLIGLIARDQKVLTSPACISITQSRLAGLARCSRQSAHALLTHLESRGLIRLTYGQCAVPDLAKLAAFADAEVVTTSPTEES